MGPNTKPTDLTKVQSPCISVVCGQGRFHPPDGTRTPTDLSDKSQPVDRPAGRRTATAHAAPRRILRAGAGLSSVSPHGICDALRNSAAKRRRNRLADLGDLIG